MLAESAAAGIEPNNSALGCNGRGSSTLWWLRPHDLILRFILPFFLITSWLGSGTMHHFGAPEFIGIESILIGVACLLMLAAGCWVGQHWANGVRRSPIVLDRDRTLIALWGLGLVAIAAHIFILYGSLATGGDLLKGFLTLQQGVLYDVAANPNKVPGLTTLTQLDLLFFAIFGAYAHVFGVKPPRGILTIAAVLVLLVTMRSFLGSERLALIEVLAVWGISSVGLRRGGRSTLTWQLAPLWAAVGVFVLFAAAEYFRSWGYYITQYSSYGEFITARFFGYFATATNNGIGNYEIFGATGAPFRTALWFYKFPIWGALGLSVEIPANTNFLLRFANPEFSNPSGIFSPVNDFGILMGCAVWISLGLFSGYLYFLFQNRLPMGIILYPSWIFGFFDILRVFYWGDPRFFPALVFAVPVYLFVRARVYERRRFVPRPWRDVCPS